MILSRSLEGVITYTSPICLHGCKIKYGMGEKNLDRYSLIYVPGSQARANVWSKGSQSLGVVTS